MKCRLPSGHKFIYRKLDILASNPQGVNWCRLSICMVYGFEWFAIFENNLQDYSIDSFRVVRSCFAKSSLFIDRKYISIIWLYRFGFWSAPLNLGYFVGLITRLRILKYFANYSLDPLFVCSGHGNGFCLFRPFYMTTIIALAIFMTAVFVSAILYGDGSCLYALVTSVIGEYS